MEKYFGFCLLILAISGCIGENEEWFCKVDGKAMYSVNSQGHMGGAQKGCSCNQIRDFEFKTFGKVDEAALKSDFGC